MDSIPEWFAGVKLNYAENLLYTQWPDTKGSLSTIGKEDSKIAVTEVREGVSELRQITWRDLRARVGKLSQAMRAAGVRHGDRVAVIASNSLDTLVTFLSITALGGLFSSSSTDMGVQGILDRLVQIRPRLVFMDDWAVYNGKTVDLRPKMIQIVERMRHVEEFVGLVVQPRFSKPIELSTVPQSQTLARFSEKACSSELIFERVAFRDPFVIAYSSGTTGPPKCIVHSTGVSWTDAKFILLAEHLGSTVIK
jgi:acetoacetyl-CoA synthetase